MENLKQNPIRLYFKTKTEMEENGTTMERMEPVQRQEPRKMEPIGTKTNLIALQNKEPKQNKQDWAQKSKPCSSKKDFQLYKISSRPKQRRDLRGTKTQLQKTPPILM